MTAQKKPQVGDIRTNPETGKKQKFNENHRWENIEDHNSNQNNRKDERNAQNPAQDYESVSNVSFSNNPQMEKFIKGFAKETYAFKSVSSPIDGVTNLEFVNGGSIVIREDGKKSYTVSLYDDDEEVWTREMDDKELQKAIESESGMKKDSAFEKGAVRRRKRRTLNDDANELARGNRFTNIFIRWTEKMFPN